MLSSKLTETILRTTSVYIKKLQELGIFTVQDLLYYFPRAYEDRTQLRQIHEIDTRGVNVIRGKMNEIENLFSARGKKVTRGEFEDATGNIIEVLWFNQPHIVRMVQKGKEYILAGKIKRDFGKLTFMAPDFEEVKPEQVNTGRIIPIYTAYDTGVKAKTTISSDWLRSKMHLVLPAAKEVEDLLPKEIVQTEKLMPLAAAIKEVHFPTTFPMLEKAKHRLAFDELFLLQLEALKRKYDYQSKAEKKGKMMPLQTELVKEFIGQLPFQLTDSQRLVTYQIFKDMEKPYPMIRLLEGDVGSGKTIVATIVAYHSIKAGYQAALMAPTEVLAQQHYQRIKTQLEKYKIPVALLIGSVPKKEKGQIVSQLQDGSLPLVIGTHALIQEKVDFKNLGFVVIDEQHRFGVEQRKRLASFGYPHVLHMTATPIPRTLALTIYGDQDLSILNEMPKGRIPIVTRVIPSKKRLEAYRFIESEINKGHQAYVICPLIEESETLQFRTVKEEYKRLKEDVFAAYNIGLLHGRLKSEAKEEVMRDFGSGKIQLLVSTTVIEVGIDVKNANVMMIEGADRFGLSQLHQLRGRVGRGETQSYCFLFTDNDSEEALKRLKVLEKTNNGFEIAEEDLKLRGPGEVYGLRQSGLPDLRMADLLNVSLIEKTRKYASDILETDPELSQHPKLAEQLNKEGEWIIS